MRVCQLKLNQFRNYRELDFVPEPGINILHGENAQGKSNVLEAISLLATTRSLRAGRESELILRDAEMAQVLAEIDREREGDAELQVSIFQSDKKTVRINGLKRPRVIDLLGQFNAVFFGAIDLAIVSGEPSDRRHYLNVEISQISPRYVYDLAHYKRALQQRNRLLRDLRENRRSSREAGLDIWDEQLVIHGAPILEKRRFYIDRLAPLADQIHRELTDGREGLEVRYLSSVTLPEADLGFMKDQVRESGAEDRYLAEIAAQTEGMLPAGVAAVAGVHSDVQGPVPTSISVSAPTLQAPAVEAIANTFRNQLGALASEELRRGGTLLGPQRDDLSLRIDGMEARVYGSQGQQRTVALALKLAEFRLIEDYVGEPPVMLLDDVMSDLDDIRRAHLLHWVKRRCQTFLTCTNLRSFSQEILAEATTFHVVAGTVTSDAHR